MIIKSSEFIISAVKPNQYPETTYQEIAISGKSNVGKSSFINTLINRKHLVKTSSTPGCTKLINFFLINKSLMLVDLPGYGYAKVPMYIKKNWKFTIETYLKKRKPLKILVLIMDIRRKPKTEELIYINWLNYYKIKKIIILTKIDKLSKNKIIEQLNIISNELDYKKSNIILFSSKKKIGINNTWKSITNLLRT